MNYFNNKPEIHQLVKRQTIKHRSRNCVFSNIKHIMIPKQQNEPSGSTRLMDYRCLRLRAAKQLSPPPRDLLCLGMMPFVFPMGSPNWWIQLSNSALGRGQQNSYVLSLDFFVSFLASRKIAGKCKICPKHSKFKIYPNRF